MPKLSGSVYQYGTSERVAHAVVRATQEGLPPGQAVSDDDGDFDLGNLDPGKWTLVALHEGSFPSKAQEIDLVQDETGIRIDLFRLQGTQDEDAGQNFFTGLLIALGVLIAFYVVLHLLVPGVREPLSVTLATLVAGAEQQAANLDDLSQSAELAAAVSDIGVGLETLLAQTPELNAADREILRTTLAEIQAATAENRKADALAGLARLRRLVETPSSLGFVIWGREPLRFLEVFLWGLAGVLVNKIITVGWYLRNQRFYREGVVMHIANIATAPLLVLVTVFLLSLFTLQLTLAGSNEVTVDLSDPRLLAAVSFLLGSQPWSIWDFAQETARRFTARQD